MFKYLGTLGYWSPEYLNFFQSELALPFFLSSPSALIRVLGLGDLASVGDIWSPLSALLAEGPYGPFFSLSL